MTVLQQPPTTASSVPSPSFEPIVVDGVGLRSPKAHRGVTHRTTSPEATWNNIVAHLGRYGITRLADITGLDRVGIPVFAASRPNGKTLSSSSGKGATTMASRVSAAMEGIEISMWEEEAAQVRLATRRELQAEGYSADVTALTTKDSLLHDAFAVDWAPAWDIVNQRPGYIPAQIVENQPGDRPGSRWNCFSMSSNGLASGNSVLEAITSGLLEVIERDAVAVAVAAHGVVARIPRAETASLGDERVDALIQQFHDAAVHPILYDCTTDIGIPVFLAVVIDEMTPQYGVFKGYGCHLDPAIAAIRALTEAAQSRTLIIAGARDDILGTGRLVATKHDPRELASNFLDVPLHAVEPRPDRSTTSFEGDLHTTIEQLAGVGLDEVFVYRYGQNGRSSLGDDHPVEVVRVVVPGCEGYLFEHYAPGPRALRARQQRADRQDRESEST